MNEPIRILQTGLTQNLGGIESFVMNVYRNIDRSKIQFDFLDNCGGIYFKDEIKQLGGTIIEIPTRRENFLEYRRINNDLMKSGKYVAVHCNCLSVANIDIAKQAYKYGKTKVIIHSHQDMKLRHLKSEILHRYNRLWLRNKDIYRFACSTKAAKWIHGNNITNKRKFELIPNAISIERYKYNPEIMMQYKKKFNVEDKLVVGCVGRFAYQKNHDFLIDVFYQLLKIRDDAVLMLVGGDGGLLESAKEKIKQLGIDNKVLFLGIREDVDKIIQAFDVFVLPSRWEGLGIVYIESQAAGLLTIGSSVVPNEAKVCEAMHFLSLNDTPKEWAQNIINLLEHHVRKDYSKELIKNGYSIEDMSKRMQEFYLSLR